MKNFFFALWLAGFLFAGACDTVAATCIAPLKGCWQSLRSIEFGDDYYRSQGETFPLKCQETDTHLIFILDVPLIGSETYYVHKASITETSFRRTNNAPGGPRDGVEFTRIPCDAHSLQ